MEQTTNYFSYLRSHIEGIILWPMADTQAENSVEGRLCWSCSMRDVSQQCHRKFFFFGAQILATYSGISARTRDVLRTAHWQRPTVVTVLYSKLTIATVSAITTLMPRTLNALRSLALPILDVTLSWPWNRGTDEGGNAKLRLIAIIAPEVGFDPCISNMESAFTSHLSVW